MPSLRVYGVVPWKMSTRDQGLWASYFYFSAYTGCIDLNITVYKKGVEEKGIKNSRNNKRQWSGIRSWCFLICGNTHTQIYIYKRLNWCNSLSIWVYHLEHRSFNCACISIICTYRVRTPKYTFFFDKHNIHRIYLYNLFRLFPHMSDWLSKLVVILLLTVCVQDLTRKNPPTPSSWKEVKWDRFKRGEAFYFFIDPIIASNTFETWWYHCLWISINPCTRSVHRTKHQLIHTGTTTSIPYVDHSFV